MRPIGVNVRWQDPPLLSWPSQCQREVRVTNNKGQKSKVLHGGATASAPKSWRHIRYRDCWPSPSDFVTRHSSLCPYVRSCQNLARFAHDLARNGLKGAGAQRREISSPRPPVCANLKIPQPPLTKGDCAYAWRDRANVLTRADYSKHTRADCPLLFPLTLIPMTPPA